MRVAACALLIMLATAAHAQVTMGDLLRDAESKLKEGSPAEARHMAITIANNALRDSTGEVARQVLQRAALIRAYADRALFNQTEAEWYWYVAKSLSTSDDEMTLGGPPMTMPALHDTTPRLNPPIVAPRVIERVQPMYPHATRMSRVQMPIIIEIIIDERGVARQPLVVTTHRNASLEYAAMEAVAKWKFEPATLDGKPVAVIFDLTINFKLV